MAKRSDNEKTEKEREHWMNHFAKGFDALFEEIKGTVPEDFKTHTRNSIRELLLAVEALIDHGVKRLEKKEKSPKAPRKVEVK